ncbi:MAG: ScpA family protein [Rhodospirillales bacterium]|jgi:segregation and condensation protein A|nr:ScpA family protein [Rhodospirillales bacterium]
MEVGEEFEEARLMGVPEDSRFVVDIEGYEGPIDVLLALAREQKVDVTQISILQLADQYLEFVSRVRRANLELAADYLVMAAWLAYLKSRLLLPDSGAEDEPSGEEMAEALAFQLRRLEAMREAGARLMARPRLGRDVLARGAPERFTATTRPVYEATLFELLKAYGDQRRRVEGRTLHIEPTEYLSMEEALRSLRGVLGGITDWESLWRFLPAGLGPDTPSRSAFASTFAASLELAREGKLKLRQDTAFGPIYLRATGAGRGAGGGNDEGPGGNGEP